MNYFFDMIQSLYKPVRKVFLSVTEGPTGYEIQLGELKDPQAFEKGQAILVPGENPNLLWDLLHDFMGLPYPQLIPKTPIPSNPQPKEPEVEFSVPVKEQKTSPGSLEEIFQSLNAKEIVAKVAKEKGIVITNSLKSKAAIVKKALKIYSEL